MSWKQATSPYVANISIYQYNNSGNNNDDNTFVYS